MEYLRPTFPSAERTRWLTALLLGLALSFLAGSCSDSKDAGSTPAQKESPSSEESIQKIFSWAERAGWEKALPKIELLISKYPQDPEWKALAVRAELELEAWRPAVERLKAALAIHPDSAALMTEEGVVEFLRGRQKAAIETLQPVVDRDPENARALEYLGRSLEFEAMIEMGSKGLDFDVLAQSITTLERSVNAEPTVERMVALALALERAQRLEDAVTVLDRAGSLEPTHEPTWHTLGRLHRELGNFETSESSFRNCFQIRNDNAAAFYDYGLLLEAQEELVRAMSIYEQAIKVDATYVRAYYRATVVLGQLGEEASAQAYQRQFEELSKLVNDLQGWQIINQEDPNDPEAQLQIGIANARLKRWEDALPWLDRAVTSSPEDARGHFQRGRAQFHLGQTAEAYLSLSKAVELNPNHLAAHRLLPQVANPLGRVAVGLESFRFLAEREPNDPDHWFNIGVAMCMVETKEGAIEAFDRCLALDPNHVQGLEQVALAEFELNRLDDAQAHLDALLSLKPKKESALQLGLAIAEKRAQGDG